MRWKAHFFLKGEKSQENTRNFGLSSNKTPPTVLELKPFEEDVIKLQETIKFRDTKDYFQDTLANDLKKINSSDKMFVFADKTRNIYETSLDTYNKLLHENITKTRSFEKTKKREAFISLKDHKENFQTNPKCRLINPAKAIPEKLVNQFWTD